MACIAVTWPILAFAAAALFVVWAMLGWGEGTHLRQRGWFCAMAVDASKLPAVASSSSPVMRPRSLRRAGLLFAVTLATGVRSGPRRYRPAEAQWALATP